MALDYRLRQIVSKAAGIYFLVTDNSQVQTITDESRLRVMFINEKQGPANCLVEFAQDDISGFESVFGTAKRSEEKKGNFGIKVCEDALVSGPIGVINLQKFEGVKDGNTEITFTSNTVSLPTNGAYQGSYKEVDSSWNIVPQEVNYIDLFDRNGFWKATPKKITNTFPTIALPETYANQKYLNFGNVGTKTISIFVVKSSETEVENLTADYSKNLQDTQLSIEEYEGIDWNVLLKDTFVTVYMFENDFSTLGQDYAQLFTSASSTTITVENLEALSDISTSGFLRKYTGSLLPNLKNETNLDISIDTVINLEYLTTGIMCDLNIDLLDDTMPFDLTYSYLFQYTTSESTSTFGVASHKNLFCYENSNFVTGTAINANIVKVSSTLGTTITNGNTIRISGDATAALALYNDIILGDIVYLCDNNSFQSFYVLTKYTETVNSVVSYYITISGNYTIDTTVENIYHVNNFLENTDLIVKPIVLNCYTPHNEQFLDGTSTKQSEILDIMNEKWVLRGLKEVTNLRYFVDTFKSFVEPNYKYQYGLLVNDLDSVNKFVSCIINEPFISDMIASQNPLLKNSKTDVMLEYKYLPKGGNPQYTTVKFDKFTDGVGNCYFFGPGDIINRITKPLSGIISALFANKKYDFDIVANATGYLTGVTELEEKFDDTDRKYLESFRYNPVIDFDGITVFGNLSGQKTVSKQQQIHNAELLCYIKAGLYQLCKQDVFKKGSYDEYLRTQTKVTDFMDNLILLGAIKSGATAKCDLENNTDEIASYKIKLVRVDYTPYDCTDKIVFDLNIW